MGSEKEIKKVIALSEKYQKDYFEMANKQKSFSNKQILKKISLKFRRIKIDLEKIGGFK